jgi:hypothetical protein
MAIGLSTGCANLLLDSGIGAAFDGANDILEIRSGTRPTSADDAPVGTVLASFTLVSDSFAAASGGTIVGATPWTEAAADAAGNASWFRLKQSTDGGGSSATDVRIDGDVAASGSDLNLSTIVIAINDQVTITQFDLSA